MDTRLKPIGDGCWNARGPSKGPDGRSRNAPEVLRVIKDRGGCKGWHPMRRVLPKFLKTTQGRRGGQANFGVSGPLEVPTTPEIVSWQVIFVQIFKTNTGF